MYTFREPTSGRIQVAQTRSILYSSSAKLSKQHSATSPSSVSDVPIRKFLMNKYVLAFVDFGTSIE